MATQLLILLFYNRSLASLMLLLIQGGILISAAISGPA